jgi:hypothetical protein
MLGQAVFYHDNSLSGLRSLFAKLRAEDVAVAKSAVRELAPRFEWPAIAKQTRAMYLALLES